MNLLKGYTKTEKSWMMYDWANSAHSVIVVTILPIFFSTVASNMQNANSAMTIWGYATSIAMAIIALLSPMLGVLGDFVGWRKKMFTGFMLVGVLACVGLSVTPMLDFVSDGAAETVGMMILVLYIFSSIGFSGSVLYADSFLSDVTTDDRMDKVSTMGYGLGYIGGSTIPLTIFLVMNVMGIDMLVCLAFIFGFTALWWGAFSIPMLKNVKQTTGVPYEKGAIVAAFKNLANTLKEIVSHKALFIFLIAYFFYIDGVHTIISMSTSYGATLGLGSTDMMLALLLVQILGLPFCLLYIKLSEKFGTHTMVGVGIGVYCIATVCGFFMSEIWHFWGLAVLIATSQGGIQALSRSMFGKLIPDKNRSGEFFGFYDIFGKVSAIMGPSLVAFVSAMVAQSMAKAEGLDIPTAEIQATAAPWGILSLLVIFFIGGSLYFFVLPKYLDKNMANK